MTENENTLAESIKAIGDEMAAERMTMPAENPGWAELMQIVLETQAELRQFRADYGWLPDRDTLAEQGESRRYRAMEMALSRPHANPDIHRVISDARAIEDYLAGIVNVAQAANLSPEEMYRKAADLGLLRIDAQRVSQAVDDYVLGRSTNEAQNEQADPDYAFAGWRWRRKSDDTVWTEVRRSITGATLRRYPDEQFQLFSELETEFESLGAPPQ